MSRKSKRAKKTKEPKKPPVPRRNLDASLPVYQLKVTIDGIDPPIWRRVQVENYHLGMLHEVMLELFDWSDDYSHAFYRPWLGRSRRHGEIWDDEEAVRLSDVVAANYEKFVYVYGRDTWYHTIEIEATLPIDPDARYPWCLGGERAGPYEECGGPRGWESLIEAVRNEKGDDDRRKRIDPETFNPEAFDLDEMGRRLRRLRGWLAAEMPPSGTPVFSEDEPVRVKPGVVHPEYPDLLLGGWAGEVEAVGYLTPRIYQVAWTPETLALAHPVYTRRCVRDDLDPKTAWLEEDQLVADPGGRVELQEPVHLQTRPLSPDRAEDRVRMIFGVTSDDRVPEVTRETLETYRQYLAQNLRFPFDVEVVDEENYPAKAVSLCELSHDAEGLELELSSGDDFFTLQLDEIVCPDDADPNARLIDDYQQWFDDLGMPLEPFDQDEEEDEDEDDGEWDLGEAAEDEEDELDDEDDFDEDGDYEDDEEDRYEPDEDELSDEPVPPARLVSGETIARNEPCPCGSGKKYKQCCLRKEDSP